MITTTVDRIITRDPGSRWSDCSEDQHFYLPDEFVDWAAANGLPDDEIIDLHLFVKTECDGQPDVPTHRCVAAEVVRWLTDGPTAGRREAMPLPSSLAARLGRFYADEISKAYAGW